MIKRITNLDEIEKLKELSKQNDIEIIVVYKDTLYIIQWGGIDIYIYDVNDTSDNNLKDIYRMSTTLLSSYGGIHLD